MQNHLGERGRRVWVASEAEALEHGGVAIEHEATGQEERLFRELRKWLIHKMLRRRIGRGWKAAVEKKSVRNIRARNGNWKAFLIHR
jgi:hypothetical protein